MKKEEIKKGILEQTEELDKLLTDRISELHTLAGTHQGQYLQGARHTFCYYRDFVWKIRDLARELKD